MLLGLVFLGRVRLVPSALMRLVATGRMRPQASRRKPATSARLRPRSSSSRGHGAGSGRLRYGRRDSGQVSILIFGLLGIVLLLVLGGIDVTAAQIARTRLLDASDSASLEAANALDEGAAYTNGIGSSIVVSNETVDRAAATSLATRPMPYGISAWHTAAGTGTTDGHTAVVVVEGVADLPMTGGLLSALGRSVTITVESRARAPLR